MEIELCASSSSSPGDYYVVTFRSNEERVWVLCDCAAAGGGMFCKHRRAFIGGDPAMLFDAADRWIFDSLQEEPHLQPLKEVLQRYETSLAEIERQKKSLKEREKSLKSSFAMQILQGVHHTQI